jgi:ATP-dependent protease ClpP protease subunit
MPYANEHACRLREPSQFTAGSFRRVERKHEGKAYGIIMGRLKGQDTLTEQAYRYPTETWTKATAQAHCRNHEGSFEAAGPPRARARACASCGGAVSAHEVAEEVERRTARPVQHVAANSGHPLLRAQAAEATADLYLYDAIGGFFGLSAAQVVAELRELEAARLRVHINSPGGDVFDGLAIFNSLTQWPGEVETVVEGLAGSIAGIIALAGRTVSMAPASFLMIHEPHGVAVGNAARMRHLGALLDKASGVLADVYAAKSGAPLADVRSWMAAETWYTAPEAVAAGLADAILAEPVAGAPEALAAFDLSGLAHVPAQLAAPTPRPKPRPPAPPPRPTPAPARARAALLAQSLGYLVGG